MNAPFKVLASRRVDVPAALPKCAPPAPLMPSLVGRRLQCYVALFVADMVALCTAFAAAGFLYDPAGIAKATLFAGCLVPVFVIHSFRNGAYSVTALRDARFGSRRAIAALLISLLAVQFIAFYLKSNEAFSRVAVTLGIALSVVTIRWTRMKMRAFVHWFCGGHIVNELVIDDGGPRVDGRANYRINAEDFALFPLLDDPHQIQRIGLFLRHADRVVISCAPERRWAWSLILKGANVAGEVIDETVAELGAQGARVVEGQGRLVVSSGPLGLRQRVSKRLLDISISFAALVVLSPLLLLVMLAILVEDGRPLFFAQKRLGRGNRFFTIYKFRSMSADRSDAEGSTSASQDDDRITRVGKFIRRTSIDELPQLLNVLGGSMSLVGPRPHAIGSLAGDKPFWQVDESYWTRHALKPGITGLAQIRGLRGATRQENDLSGRLSADLEYLRGWSLWRDVRIMVATLGVVVHERAY